ncbi:MAG TPA: Fic/DOC family N-terminal domain-containing protein [Nitriliruptorales bacterium]
MDLAVFGRSPVGRLEPIVVTDARDGVGYEHAAFVPAPLPRSLALGTDTIAALLDAQLALGRLDGAATELPDPLLLVRPIIRREAVSTSALEGTYTELAELMRDEVVGDPRDQDVREVLNYVLAAEHGLARLEVRPIGTNLVNELHDLLVRGTRGDSAERGSVRRHQNWIGSRGSRVIDAHFVPPPPGDRLREGLTDWERYIHDQDVPLLVRCALGHYQFETLHPYNDGNGRLGRLLIVLQLIAGGALAHHLVSVSGYLEARRDEYVAQLQHVRATGDFQAWIEFVARALAHSGEQALVRIKTLHDLRDRIVEQVRDSGSRGTTVQVAHDVVGYPYVTIPAVAARYDRTYQAASNAVHKLVEIGVLHEVPGTSQPRAYVAIEVVRLLDL